MYVKIILYKKTLNGKVNLNNFHHGLAIHETRAVILWLTNTWRGFHCRLAEGKKRLAEWRVQGGNAAIAAAGVGRSADCRPLARRSRSDRRSLRQQTK
jgi:hypothetical protein